MGFFNRNIMKIFLYLFGLVLLLCSCGATAPVVIPKAPKQPKILADDLPDPTKPQITVVLPDIDKMLSVEATLNFLAADELQGRDTGTLGIETAAQFIEARFERAGVAPFYSTYRDAFEVNGQDAFNILGMVEGQDEQLKKEVIIIGAHYDHIGQGRKNLVNDSIANGANDNASGTTAVLALADHFAQAKNNKRTLLFALFSAEEKGLLGSKHMASQLKSGGISLYTMFNIEMIGVPMKNKDHLVYLSGFSKSNLAEKFNEYTGSKTIGFLPKAAEFGLFMRSDNYPFFQQFNVPAHTISSFDFTNFDHYHGVDDEVELMDIDHMERVINQIIPGIEQLANSLTQELKMNQ